MPATTSFDSIWLGAKLATLREGHYSIIEDGAIAVSQGRIAWVGTRKDLPAAPGALRHEFAGGLITPGLIDCHTHLIFGGNRGQEFEQRLNGMSYAEIAAAGGGILSTVMATRDADEESLLATAESRLATLMAEGVTCIEIKSGYGLTLASELKMLRVARRLAQKHPIEVKTTLLAAHALPPEYRDRSDEYIDLICLHWIPAVANEGLADAVDGFCEHLAFSPPQIERIFAAAKQAGLPVKLHAEQLSSLGGSSLAARWRALSADHLEYATDADARGITARGLLYLASNTTAAGGAFSPPRRADGAGQRSQSGHFARLFVAFDDEYGLYPVSPDAGRGAGRRHAQCRPRARSVGDAGFAGNGQNGRLRALAGGTSGRTGLLAGRTTVRHRGLSR
jgi:imidazolonepropionase